MSHPRTERREPKGTSLRRPVLLACGLALATAWAAVGFSCGTNGGGPVGGALSGPEDAHCTVAGEPIKQAIGVCVRGQAASSEPGGAGGDALNVGGGGAGGTAGGGAAGGGAAGGGMDMSEEPAPVLYNASGDDDDCKYHVSWTSTPVRENADVTFTVTVTRLIDGQPASGAAIEPEVTLDDTHVSPSLVEDASESPAGSGIYKVGPIRFDEPGKWVVRFHLYGECSDAPPDSPHGHVAFYVSVPKS